MNKLVRARCRLISDFNVVAVVGAAMLALVLGFAFTQSPDDFESWAACIAIFVLCGATPFYWLIARSRGVIFFDENGVSWHTAFSAWKSARWDEIASCDARMTSTGGTISRWKFVVKTRNGAFSWTSAFENSHELAPFAARFCALVPANVEDWPRRFGYRSGENVFAEFGTLFLSGCVLAILLALTGAGRGSEVGPPIESFVALYGWPLTLVGFALFGALALGVPALFLLFYIRIALDIWCRRDEVIVATPRGLSWRQGENQRVFARWDELQQLHIEARGPLISLPFYCLQSARGEFHWSNGLCGKTQLLQTLYKRAPDLKSVTAQNLSEELGGATVEQGDTLEFNFRTRSLRALLVASAIVSLILWGTTIFGPLEPPKGGEPLPSWASLVLAIIAMAATLYGALLFRRGCIRLDARGIEWRLPLRSQFLAWEEINELIVDRKYYLKSGARRVPLATLDIYPVRLERLLEAITERAIKASGGWKVAENRRVKERRN